MSKKKMIKNLFDRRRTGTAGVSRQRRRMSPNKRIINLARVASPNAATAVEEAPREVDLFKAPEEVRVKAPDSEAEVEDHSEETLK